MLHFRAWYTRTTHMTPPSIGPVRLYSQREWQVGSLLFTGFLAVSLLRASIIPTDTFLFPAAAVAMAGLFFGGLRLWPFVLLAAGASAAFEGLSLPLLALLPIAHTVQAVAGAYFLRSAHVDPLFRRYRDTFYFMLVAICVATILPTLVVTSELFLGRPFLLGTWGQAYLSMLTSLLIVSPFLLRWIAKPRFSRTALEWVELVCVFGVLILIGAALFIVDVQTIFGIELVYFLAIPLFWTALRHRPRWVSLAILVTAVLAIGGELLDPAVATLPQRLYEVEALLILIALSFFTIVSLEEDRRVNTNLMRSQLATLENALARITSESNAKNDFIAILAHELRNPLAPIMSGIDLMKLKEDRDPDEQATLVMMEDRMDMIRRLLDDLLDISRISEGKIALKRELLNLEDVIRHSVLSTTHYFKERHQTLVLKFPPRKKTVLGDPVRLEQVFSNLLTNASKYSDSGGTVHLTMQRSGDYVEVIITDQGIGIDPAHVEEIFTPFHQAGEVGRTKKGLGIGLALVRSFVEMHYGSVRARSRGKGLGSEFIVRLPLHESVEHSADEEPPGEVAGPVRRSSFSVLVVDDNDAAAAGIGRLLELRGCHVRYAYDGAQAIRETMNHTPDAVLLDVGLPDQDGYEVAQTLRARGYSGRLIALTGFSTDEARERGKEVGFDHYLVKPAGLADLRRVIPELG